MKYVVISGLDVVLCCVTFVVPLSSLLISPSGAVHPEHVSLCIHGSSAMLCNVVLLVCVAPGDCGCYLTTKIIVREYTGAKKRGKQLEVPYESVWIIK